MDRDTAEHLARDTGLTVDEITSDVQPGGDEVAQHLAADTGVGEDEVGESGVDATASMVQSFPVD